MTSNDTTRGQGVVLAGLAAVVSGVAVFVNGYGVRRFGDATVYTTAKNLVSALLLAALVAASRPRAGRGDVVRAHAAGLVAVGVVGGAVPFVLFFEGLARASSTEAAFVHKTLVVWVALLAVPILHERFTLLHGTAIGLLVLGQALLSGGVGELRPGSGEVMILAATILWAVETVVAKRLLSEVPSAVVAEARMGVGVVLLLGWLAATGRAGDLGALAPSQWAWALLTGGVLTAYVVTWYAALARAQALDVTSVLVFGAVVTALLDTGVRGVAVAPDLAGIALVTAGAVVAAVAATLVPHRLRASEAVPR